MKTAISPRGLQIISSLFSQLTASIKILALVVSVLLASCNKDEDEPIPAGTTSFTATDTDHVTFTSAALNGKITIGADEILDCGFVWSLSSSPSIENGDEKLFGAQTSNQDLSFEIEDLKPNTQYFVKTVLKIASGNIYGPETSFKTLRHAEFIASDVTDISFTEVTLNAKIEKHDDQIFESGFVWSKEHFPTIETSYKYYMGAQSSDRTVSHKLTALEKSSVYNYRTFLITPSGIIYGDEFSFTTLAEVVWQDPNEFPGLERMGAVSFTIGTNSFVGLGHTRDENDHLVFLKDFWKFDQIANTWIQQENFPGSGRSGAVAFSVSGKGYVGTGGSVSGGTKDFWEFDPTTGKWTSKADFLGGNVGWAVGFSIGDKGYVGTGIENGNGSFLKTFYEYDPTLNSWTRKADFPGLAVDQAIGFSIHDTGYIGLGLREESWLGNVTQLWAYSPASNSWSQKEDCPTDKSMYGSVAFVINNKAYASLGWGGESKTWEYDPETNHWTARGEIPASYRIGAVAFVIGDKAVIGTGATASTFLKDFVQFNPE